MTDQDRINTRALEVAQTALALAEKLDQRMTRNEQRYDADLREATKQRHDFRAEVALTLGGMRTELLGRIDKSDDDIGARLDKSDNRLFSGLAAIAALLLSATGFLFLKAMNWI